MSKPSRPKTETCGVCHTNHMAWAVIGICSNCIRDLPRGEDTLRLRASLEMIEAISAVHTERALGGGNRIQLADNLLAFPIAVVQPRQRTQIEVQVDHPVQPERLRIISSDIAAITIKEIRIGNKHQVVGAVPAEACQDVRLHLDTVRPHMSFTMLLESTANVPVSFQAIWEIAQL